MKKRLFSLLLAIALLSGSLWGCRASDPMRGDPADQAENEAGTVMGSVVMMPDGQRMLTGIFTSEYVPLPEGMELSQAARPAFDPETGILRLLVTCRVNETVSDGEKEFDFPVDHFSVVTLYPDGSSDETPIPLHWTGFVVCGAFEEEGFRYIELDQSTRQIRLILKTIAPDGTVSELPGDMDALFGHDFPNKMFLFPDGDTLYVQQNQVMLIGSDGNRRAADSAGSPVQDVGMTADGRILVAWNGGQGAVIAELDTDTGGFASLFSPGQTVNVVRFGPGYDFFFMDEDGVRGAFFEGEDWTSEPLLNFVNSGLNRAAELFVAPLEPEAMLFTNDRDDTLLYRYSPDLDLSDLKVLTVGCDSTSYIDPDFASAVSEFQRSHPGVRIVTEDYAGYDTREKPDGGETKLATDLVTGLFKPDMLIGPADALYMMQAQEKGLYRDLAPFLGKTGEIFGCVKRLFDDGQGGMWAVSPAFSIQTVFADPARLGTYGEQGYLSPTDFVDLQRSLADEGILLTEYLYSGITSFNWLLGWYGNGFRAFVDREAGTASFDSPEFVKVLSFLASLPTEEEARRISPLADMSAEEVMLAHRTGQILLKERPGAWAWVEPELWTGTESWMMIGYPAGENRPGAGTTVRPGMSYLITSWCEEAELAEEFIGMVLRTYSEENAGQFPPLKSVFRERAEKMYGEIYALFYDGGAGVWQEDKPHPTDEKDLGQPGILTRLTPEKTARLEAMLDEAGTPIRLSDDTEILEIVRDETLAFLSGVGTAEDCAKKIQSRVSIWLAEHK